MKTLEILTAARALISDPARHTKDLLARDAEGYCTQPESDEAVCWCSIGAVSRVVRRNNLWGAVSWYTTMLPLYDAVAPEPVGKFNDNHTHAEVLAMFDKAIESLKGNAS